MAIKELIAQMAGKIADKFGGNAGSPAPTGPKDGNANPQGRLTENQKKYGENYEKLKELRPDIVESLQSLVLQYRSEGQYAQRHRILRTRYARLFWQGIQYALYNSGTGQFDFASAAHGLQLGPGNDQDAAGARFEYVTNFYQAYGLSFISMMSQDVPSWVCYPRSRESHEDITAAKVGYDVGDLVERNNKPHRGMEEIARYLWTDGVIGQYWRYVVDGERFGFKELPIEGVRDAVVDGQRLTLPTDEGTEKIPNGQEVVTYVGGLELILPIFADDFHDCGYLQWNCEPHKAKLKAAYPHAAKGIDSQSGMTADQVYERISRLGVKQNLPLALPGDALESLPTFSRTWMRKWAFRLLTDEKKVAELEELFPDGCYCAFAGLEYCEARNETMDDHWRVLHALPGDGQSRPAVGDSLLDVQERYNTLSNLQTETYEYGIPPIYADPQVLNFDALANQNAEPAVHYPARAKPGMALQDGFFSPDPAKEPVTLAQTMQELMGPIAQFLSGIFNAAIGQNMEGLAGKTFGGYKIARDQAYGRLAMIYRRVKDFYAEGIFLGLECFKKNRPEDVEVPFPGESDEQKAKWIRLADFRGNIMVEAEADETFPRMRDEQRQLLGEILQMGPNLPQNIAKILDEPENMAWIKSVLGLTELELPDEDSSVKQMREIQLLLEKKPFQPQPLPTPQIDPATGLQRIVLVPQPPRPSIGVNDLFDRHDIELETCINWANGDLGIQAARENPAGYQNVYLHAQMHAQALAQRAAAAQQKLPSKPPSMSVAIDKMPPSVQSQALAQDGIQVDPAEIEQQQQQEAAQKAAEKAAGVQAKLQAGATQVQ